MIPFLCATENVHKEGLYSLIRWGNFWVSCRKCHQDFYCPKEALTNQKILIVVVN